MRRANARAFPTVASVCLVGLTLGLSVGSTWLARSLHADAQELVHTELEIRALAGRITHLDEVLTMSARMCAATGDLAWEARYRQHEPKLEADIHALIALAPEALRGAAAEETGAANDALVAMENRAFELVRFHRRDAAAALLDGEEYRRQKALYARGIADTNIRLADRTAALLAAQQTRVRTVVSFSLVAWALLIALWLRFGLLIRQVLRSMNDHDRTLREANEALEARVKERAAELLDANEDLKKESSARLRIEERFRAIFETSRDALVTLEPPTFAFTSANAAALAMFRADSSTELISHTPADLSPERQPDGRPSALAAQETFERAMREGAASFEWTHKRLSGEEFPADVLLTRMDHGGRQFLHATIRDITERKRLGEALRESEVLYRASFEGASVGQAIAAPDGRYVAMNSAFADMLGYSVAELWDVPFAEVTHPDDVAASVKAQKALLAGARVRRLEKRYVRKDGTILWADLNLAALRDAAGALTLFVTHVIDISERKAAEAKYRALFETSRDALMTLEPPAWSFTSGNAATLAMFRAKTQHEFTSCAPWMLSPDKQSGGRPSVDVAKAMIDEAMRTGSASFEWTHKRLSGEDFPADVLLTRMEHGGWQLLQATVRDITEQKRVGEALRESEERYRASFEGASVGLALAGLDGRFVEVNTTLAGMLGYSVAELSGMPFSDLTHPEDVAMSVEAQKALLAGERVRRMEKRYLRKDGTVLWVDVSVAALRGPNAEVTQFVTHVIDISKRKRVEAALATSEERFRELYTHMDSGVVVYQAVDGGEDFVVRDLNVAAERLNKVTRAAAIGHRVTELFPGIAAMGLLDVFQDVYRTGHPTQKAATLYQDERLAVWFESSVYRLSSGEIVAIHEDVTESRSVEEQMRQAQKMEAVGRLAGGVAHDFNNLLSIIISYAKFAQDAVREGDPLRDDILEISKAGARASAVVKELLAFSRKQVFQPEPLELSVVVTNLDGMLHRLLGDDIEVVTVLAPNLSTVQADRAQIEQVVMNLAVNAKDAMPAGGTLTIATGDVELDATSANAHRGIKPGCYVMLSITDTGIGMDEATIARIFEPFFTTKATGRGAGLGLATAYGIVKQSGGDITVESQLGRGTTFRIHLPRATDSVEAAPRPSLPVTRATGDETILVVEDEEAVRALTRRILVAAGYTVLAAANAGAALLLAERQVGRIHLLLTDVVMPQIGGKELADRLSTVCPGMRVLYMSGYTDETIAHHGVLAPGTYFIAKPFEATCLTAKVREVLDAPGDA